VAVALVSVSALAYEVLLTRLLAMVHWHHLVATVISLALLGYGVSGTFLTLIGERIVRLFPLAFVSSALLFSAAMLAAVVFAQAIGLDPQALEWQPQQLLSLAGVYLLLAVPFFAAANCIGLALWRYRAQIPRLYAVDLLGAGIGVMAVVAALRVWYPEDGIYWASGLALSAAVIAAFELAWYRFRIAALAVGGVFATIAWDPLAVNPAAYKDLSRSLLVQGAAIDAQATGVAGVVTVVRNDVVPLRSAPGLSLLATRLPAEQRAVFVDGDAVGALTRRSAETGHWADLTSALPYALLERPKVLVLNAGTGQGVMQALQLGAAAVTALDGNAALVDLLCQHYRDYTRDLCGDPAVHVEVAESRAYLQAHPERYDLIQLSAPADITGLNSQLLSYQLTEEAFVSYLDHLTPNGLLTLAVPTRLPPRLTLRLVATARQALAAAGVAQPERHIAVIRGWQRAELLVAPQPLSAARSNAVRVFARTRAFDLVWLPGIEPAEVNRYQRLAKPFFYQGVAAILTVDQAPTLLFGVRVGPVDDDGAYPFRFTTWRDLLRRVLWGGPRGSADRLDAGFAMSVATLAQAVLFSFLLILAPLALRRPRSGTEVKVWRWRTGAYFGLVGLAFLLIEVAWIHKLQRFLGHPVYATAVVLAAFLLFAGLGSRYSQRWPVGETARRLPRVSGWIVALGLLYLLGFADLLDALAAQPIAVRMGVAFTGLAPLAFGMGMPFPLGLQLVAARAPDLVPWAWGVNGCASVMSAVAAPLLAMEIGYSGVLLTGLAAYLGVSWIMPRRQ
jgi:spermidine synthase